VKRPHEANGDDHEREAKERPISASHALAFLKMESQWHRSGAQQQSKSFPRSFETSSFNWTTFPAMTEQLAEQAHRQLS